MARGRGCVTTDLPPTAGVATYDCRRSSAPFTLIGHAAACGSATGRPAPDVQLNSRLWDVAPDGARRSSRAAPTGPCCRTRPAPRPSTRCSATTGASRPGHTLRLEVANVDAPYLRPDNFPALTTIDDARLVLPGGTDVRAAVRVAVAARRGGPGLRRRSRPTRRTTRCSTPARCRARPTSSGTWRARRSASTAASRSRAPGR